MSTHFEHVNKYAQLVLDHAAKLDEIVNNGSDNRRNKPIAISHFSGIKENIDKMNLPKWQATRLKDAPYTDSSLKGRYYEYYANELEEWLDEN